MNIVKDFEPQKYSEQLVNWLKKNCLNYPAEGFVIGLSGGIDSAVAAALAVQTGLTVTALIMPSENNNSEDTHDAINLAKALNMDYHILPIQPVYETFLTTAKDISNSQNNREHIIKGNAQARFRMMYLYMYAQQNNRIVIGTDNACEWYMGYFTKFGDGAADILPLIELKKSQVFALGKYLKISDNILNKAPSAGLWQGQTDEDEMGVTYQEIDSFLDGQTVSEHALDRINYWHNRSHHKRNPALKPNFNV
jgi:NAD+ synthase